MAKVIDVTRGMAKKRPVELDVVFSSQSGDDVKSSIGFCIDCDFDELEGHARLLAAGKPLEAVLKCSPSKHVDQDGQSKMPGCDVEIHGIAESGGITFQNKKLRARLKFDGSVVGVADLVKLVKKQGFLSLLPLGDGA